MSRNITARVIIYVVHNASLGLHMQFITLFMSDKEKHGHHFDLPLFFNMSQNFLAPGGLSVSSVFELV